MATKKKIKLATLKLFAQKGFEATSIRDIAMEAGINSSTLYHYIKSKEDFLITIMEEGLTGLINEAEKLVENIESSTELVAELTKIHVKIHAEQQLTMLVTDSEYRSLNGTNKTKIRNLRKKYELIWRQAIKEGIDSGEFMDISDDDIKLTVFAILSKSTGIVNWYSKDGELSLDYISDSFARMTLNLLGVKQIS